MNMSYQTTIPADKIDFVELNDLLEKLSNVMGVEVVVERQFVIGVEDAALSNILDTIADGLIRNGKKKNPEGKVDKKKTLKKGPTAVAKYLQGVATEWGMKLPSDFLETAKGYEPVTVETGKKRKKE